MTKDQIDDETSPEFRRYPCRLQPGPVMRASLCTDTPTRTTPRPCTRSVLGQSIQSGECVHTCTKKIDEPKGSLDRMIDVVMPLKGFVRQISEKRRRCCDRQTRANNSGLWISDRTRWDTINPVWITAGRSELIFRLGSPEGMEGYL
jgi:hypothetical protein